MVRDSACDVVVVGLGYVGLPLCAAASQTGLAVVGLDVDPDRVRAVNAGEVVADDLSAAAMGELLGAGFEATTDHAVIESAQAVVLCVPTPLSDGGGPDLANVRAAARAIAPRLGRGQLVVLESTSYPGTTDEVLAPTLEAGSGLRAGTDFHVAYSPERIDPGNPVWGVANTPKVVGGLTAACGRAAADLYRRFVARVVATAGPREAEMAKLLENTYRHVNIALVNEMAVFCDELGVDLWAAIAAAATKPFGYQAFYPGPGVGGHCIPIDPNYLGYKVRTLGYPFRFVELAGEINQRMPGYVCQRIARLLNDAKKPVNGSRVLLLGVTYKPDVADERQSPAIELARRLDELGADLAYHDPFVAEWGWAPTARPLAREADLDRAVADADCVVLLQAHAAYDLARLAATAALVLDTRGAMDGATVERL
ncbi:MAG: nucleotide sugar dehydrogenase [Actinobacteria bacterium QS_8_72_14]|nr:MAG: nucleotide sugar dehydrogenase [Actinobacteria bacterium QS_8_72_14]